MQEKILIVIVILLFIYVIYNNDKKETLANVTVIENNPDNIVIQDGNIRKKVSKICTHMGCTLNLNKDKLECPCHGSTFDLDGKVITGPARDNLEVTTLSEKFENYNKFKSLEW
jgi:Rieske Fe-S protein